MKVVLFCGGLGTRLREHSETTPKPLVHIGVRPIIWHLMRYYAHFGHKEFILCLGYRGDMVREYFLKYNECLSNDFVLSEAGRKVELMSADTSDWRITFVDTGLHTNIGQRLMRVRQYLQGDPVFLANYSDGLSDLPLDAQLADFSSRNVVASFVGAKLPQSMHVVRSADDGVVTGIESFRDADLWVNAGFFCFRADIFDYIQAGEELVEQPFQRLLAARKLAVYRYDGFWQCMDTFKDKIAFDRMDGRSECPWMLWKPRKS